MAAVGVIARAVSLGQCLFPLPPLRPLRPLSEGRVRGGQLGVRLRLMGWGLSLGGQGLLVCVCLLPRLHGPWAHSTLKETLPWQGGA